MIIENLPAAEYHARPELNFSRLKRMHRSPLYFQRGPAETSSGFVMGGPIHTAVLEQEKFHTRYQRQVIRRTQKGDGETTMRSGKAWDTELAEATAAGREILKPEVYDEAQTIADAIYSKPGARRLLLGARKELTIIQTLQGVPVRCRLDFMQPGTALGDLKKCGDLTRFFIDVEKYHYLGQAAFYSDIWHAETGERMPWKWIAAEDWAPYDCAVIAASEADIQAGRALYEGWMERHARCLERGEWPGVDQGADEIALVRPHWVTLDSEEIYEETSDDE